MAERLPILDELGAALDDAFARAEAEEARARAERARRGWRLLRRDRRGGRGGAGPRRSLVLASLVLTLLGATAAGGTVVVLRGTVIPAPDPQVAGPAQTPAPGTSRLADARAADPSGGGARWALRVARSRTGLVCGTVAQERGARFGLTGLDGRFRDVPERLVDACTAPRERGATLLGVRVFDARADRDVRTVLYGLAEGLEAVDVSARGRRERVPVARDGSFAAAYAGYPEDVVLRVTLRFAGGRAEEHPFGTGDDVVPDPDGGRAWHVESLMFGTPPGQTPDPRTCVNFRPARPGGPPVLSPAACGVLRGTRERRGLFFAVRRIEPGTGGIPIDIGGEGNWGKHPARTAVWGAAGDDVRRIEVLGAGGRATPVRPARGGTFLALFPGAVDPARLRVRVTGTDGRARTYTGSTNLVSGRVK